MLSALALLAIVITITACGGRAPGSLGAAARGLIFNANPVGLHITKGFGTVSASAAGAFTVNAQTVAPGGGNFSGFCDVLQQGSARTASPIFGLGLWSSGACNTQPGAAANVGVAIPQAGQIGNVSVDAFGTGTVADDGKVGLDSTASGQVEVVVLHQDGTQTITPVSCSLGVSSNASVHCDDKAQAAHHTNVAAGDQVIAFFWYNPADTYRSIRVNIEYATPSF
jgi:hypothetical protein